MAKKTLHEILGRIRGAVDQATDRKAFERSEAEQGIKREDHYDVASAEKRADFFKARREEREYKRSPRLMKHELDLVDRQELAHYQELIIGKQSNNLAREVMGPQHRSEQFRVMMGDKTDLEKYRKMEHWSGHVAYFEAKREAVRNMSAKELRESAAERQKSMDRGARDIANDRW